jgi:hypothetical protein
MNIGDILIWEATNGLLLIPVVIGLVMFGSGRAELPHPALALGNNAKAHQRMRMITPLTPFTAGCLTYPLKRAGHVLRARMRPLSECGGYDAGPFSPSAIGSFWSAIHGEKSSHFTCG